MTGLETYFSDLRVLNVCLVDNFILVGHRELQELLFRIRCVNRAIIGPVQAAKFTIDPISQFWCTVNIARDKTELLLTPSAVKIILVSQLNPASRRHGNILRCTGTCSNRLDLATCSGHVEMGGGWCWLLRSSPLPDYR